MGAAMDALQRLWQGMDNWVAKHGILSGSALPTLTALAGVWLGGCASLAVNGWFTPRAPSIQFNHVSPRVDMCTEIQGTGDRDQYWSLWLAVRPDVLASRYTLRSVQWDSDAEWRANLKVGQRDTSGIGYTIVAFEVPASWDTFLQGLSGASYGGSGGYATLNRLPPAAAARTAIHVIRATGGGPRSC